MSSIQIPSLKNFKISVIIPTFNGANTILQTLKALEDQTYKDFGVIIIIDGSTDNTKELLNRKEYDFNFLQIIEQQNKGRSAARNRGALQSQDDLLVFYDDDTRPLPDSVRRHIEFHSSQLNSVCGGMIIEDKNFLKTDIQYFRDSLNQKWTSSFSEGDNKLNKKNIFLTAANFSISKYLLEKIHGFDERLRDIEDFDLAVRIFNQGNDIFFDKNNIALHHDPITCKNYIKRLREYNAARHFLFELKPDLYKLYPDRFNYFPSLIKRVIFLVLSKNIWVKWIDQEKLIWLPRHIRFKMYDLIITGLSSVYTERDLE